MGLFDQTDDEWLARLTRKVDAQAKCDAEWWQYYDNEQPLRYVATILLEQGNRFPPMMVNWSELVIGAAEEREDLDGFRLGDSDSVDDDLQAWWQDNDLDESSGEAHIAAMVTGQSFIMLGSADSPWLQGVRDATSADGAPAGDSPLVTIEYSDQVAVEIEPSSRRVVAGIKRWKSDAKLTVPDMRCLYLPHKTIVYQGQGKKAQVVERVESEDLAVTLLEHRTSPLIPIVPMLNRRRRGLGYSELVDMKPLVDAMNQVSTNMLAGVEHHAVPRKAAINIDPAQFVDENGNRIPTWKIATGAVWAIPPAVDEEGHRVPASEADRPQIIQFTASDLTNYTTVAKQIATLAGSKYGLPPHYMGYTSENPASADAIRSSEARLVKRVERKNRGFGGSWEQAARIALVLMGKPPAAGSAIETVWRDPSTPTKAAMADRTVKLHAEGIIDREQALEDLGYTPGQIKNMLAREQGANQRVGNIVSGLRSLDVARTGAGNTPPPQQNGNGIPQPVPAGAAAG